MSTPVTTERWAGNFDCSGPCRRKRLIGDEFSKKALERYRKDTSGNLKCKQCVEEAAKQERHAAEARRKAKEEAGQGSSATNGQSEEGSETQQNACAGPCGRSLPDSAFNRNQLAKKDKARCRECVEKAIEEENNANKSKLDSQIAEAKEALKNAEARKAPSTEIFKAANHLASLEAQKVTGLKPTKMGRGRGRGRSGARVGGRGG
jgi:hypothetical protein